MENNMKSASHTLSHREDKPKTFRVLLSITTEEDERLVAETFRAHHVPLIAEIRGKGTAPSEFLDILGLGGSTRILTFGCVPTQQVPELFSAMKQTLSYHRRGTGIALTLPLSGAQKALVQLLNIPVQSKEEIPMSDQQSNAPAYSMILVMTTLFQAEGKALPALILAVSRQGVVLICCLYLLRAVLGYTGILIAQPAADVITLIIAGMLAKGLTPVP